MCKTLWRYLGLMFDFAKMFSIAIFSTYFYHKGFWVAATDYYMFLNLKVLSPLTLLLRLRNLQLITSQCNWQFIQFLLRSGGFNSQQSSKLGYKFLQVIFGRFDCDMQIYFSK